LRSESRKIGHETQITVFLVFGLCPYDGLSTVLTASVDARILVYEDIALFRREKPDLSREVFCSRNLLMQLLMSR
jgi:hypothetical protein